jgi:hypothetical protein
MHGKIHRAGAGNGINFKKKDIKVKRKIRKKLDNEKVFGYIFSRFDLPAIKLLLPKRVFCSVRAPKIYGAAPDTFYIR